MHFFCLDIGGTETRGAVFGRDGQIVGRAKGIGGALSLGVEQSEAAIRDVWDKIAGAAPGLSRQSTRLCAGIAGFSLPGRAAALGARLHDFDGTHFVGDGYGALLAATEGRPGALISVGTGVTALRLDATGETLALGGWGFPAGDLGSGAWLGLQLVGLLSKHLDGVRLQSPFPAHLQQALQQITGGTAAALIEWQSTARPRQFGSLVPALVASAERGDAFSQGLLAKAASEIADLARALYKGEAGDVVLGGGLGPILAPFCRASAPEMGWETKTIDPVMGLFLLAAAKAPPQKLQSRPGFAGTTEAGS